MSPQDLMEVARVLVEPGDAPTTQARLRRAISTAYYAMFHCLAMSAADLFIGTVRSPAWHRTYRALEHGRARIACRQVQAMSEFPVAVRDFAETFVALQKARQEADYAQDTATHQKSDVRDHIASAELAIRQFGQAAVDAKRSLVAHVLFRQRPPLGG